MRARARAFKRKVISFGTPVTKKKPKIDNLGCQFWLFAVTF